MGVGIDTVLRALRHIACRHTEGFPKKVFIVAQENPGAHGNRKPLVRVKCDRICFFNPFQMSGGF